MKINSAEIFLLNIPFKLNFKHANASRMNSDSIILKIESENFAGYGEILIRDYVSGKFWDFENKKNFEKVSIILKQRLKPLLNIELKWDDVKKFLSGMELFDSSELPLLCGIETALLNLSCEFFNKDIYNLISLTPFRESIVYSGILPVLSKLKAKIILNKYKNYNIKTIRVKLTSNYKYNNGILKIIRKIMGDDYDVRVDVNSSWNNIKDLDNLKLCKDHNIKIIEDPFNRENEKNFDKVLFKNEFIFMADESFLDINDLKTIIKNKNYKMINIRLAKNGGIFKCLKLAEIAEENNIGCQVGCQVGETGILSCLGRITASLLKNPIYTDGSFDSYLLKENITTANFNFDFGGIANIVRNKGIGYNIDEIKLKRLSVKNLKLF